MEAIGPDETVLPIPAHRALAGADGVVRGRGRPHGDPFPGGGRDALRRFITNDQGGP